jgi:hypothetical protein
MLRRVVQERSEQASEQIQAIGSLDAALGHARMRTRLSTARVCGDVA